MKGHTQRMGAAGQAWARRAAIALCAVAGLGCAPAIKDIPPEAPSPVLLEEIRAQDGGSIDVLPRLIRYTAPEYPQQAIFNNISGSIRLAADVDERGRITEIRVLRSLPDFDIVCIEAMQSWRFSPALREGQPVAFTVSIPFSFQVQ